MLLENKRTPEEPLTTTAPSKKFAEGLAFTLAWSKLATEFVSTRTAPVCAPGSTFRVESYATYQSCSGVAGSTSTVSPLSAFPAKACLLYTSDAADERSS